MANTVQSNISSQVSNQFNVNIGLNLQSKLTDWPSRQDMQYESMKGNMNLDFHGLEDFNFQMAAYSATNGILSAAWNIIKGMAPNNPKLLMSLVKIPGFGQVGQSVLSLIGIQSILVAPQSILQNPTALASTIKSLS